MLNLNKFIAVTLKEIIKLFDFEYNGNLIEFDEIEIHSKPQRDRILNNDQNHYYHGIFNLREPRLCFTHHFLNQYLYFVTFKSKGVVQPVNSYRLKNLSQWCNYPYENIYEYLGPPSSYCNCNCEICYESCNPLAYAKRKSLLSIQEAKTRLKYYDPGKKLGLPPANFVYGEPFLNKNLLEIYSIVEESENDQAMITTNASFLTEEVCKKVARLKNVKLTVSINSLNPILRQKVMGDSKKDGTEIALNSLSHLHKYIIPYDVSITGWPSLPLEDIEKTILELEQFEPDLVRVCLPGFNKYNCPEQTELLYDRWDGLVELVIKLKPIVSFPLVSIPALYNFSTSLQPIIDGVYKHSPAYEAGLKVNDLVIAFNHTPIYLKSQLTSKLKQSSNLSQITLTIRREDDQFDLILNRQTPKKDQTPPRWGLFLNQTFKISYIESLKNILQKHSPKNVVIFTSKIIAPIIQQLIEQIDYYREFFAQYNIIYDICPHYFWGGNIMINDLHLVSDFSQRLQEITNEQKIDLVVIPSSIFNEWGLDIAGSSIYELNKFNLPIELLQCDRINV